jgi:hypothetical protein
MVEADPGLPKAVPTERARVIAAISGSDGAGKALALAIENDLSFGALRSGWFALPGGFGMSIRSSAIANRLLDGVIIGNSAKSLIDEARAFAASPICTVESYTPIAGATVVNRAGIAGGHFV